MRYTNFLSKLLDWLREVFEHASPSIFSLFAALLPYLSPLPVAVMTAESSETYLGFTPQVAGVFVFVLEGLGLWTTTMLVDSVVDFIRSRNWKNVFNIVIFLGVVVVYVFILINLNVSLEQTTGNSDPTYSRILTLICFLPLISGVMNGYWKLKLEHKTELAHQKALEEQHYQEARADKKEKWIIQHTYETPGITSRSGGRVPKVTSRTRATSGNSSGSNNGTSKMGRPSTHQERVFSYLDETYSRSGVVPTFTEVMNHLGLSQSTASRLRNEWLEGKQ